VKSAPALIVLAALLAFLLGLWLGWQANSFLAQDACLDRGGAWDEQARACRGTPAANLPSIKQQ
jgi:hypothetical protein